MKRLAILTVLGAGVVLALGKIAQMGAGAM